MCWNYNADYTYNLNMQNLASTYSRNFPLWKQMRTSALSLLSPLLDWFDFVFYLTIEAACVSWTFSAITRTTLCCSMLYLIVVITLLVIVSIEFSIYFWFDKQCISLWLSGLFRMLFWMTRLNSALLQANSAALLAFTEILNSPQRTQRKAHFLFSSEIVFRADCGSCEIFWVLF